MSVRTEERGSLGANRSVAQCRAFGRAGNDSDVLCHCLILLKYRSSIHRATVADMSSSRRTDVDFMQRALELSQLAQAAGEVPVGAVLVHDGRIIAEGSNRPIASNDPTAHAEIEALRAAGQVLSSYRLTDTTLYVTLEPCVMCASAMVHARVRRCVFGAWDPRAGAAGSLVNIFGLPGLNHRVDVFGGVLAEECSRGLKQFFADRRG